MWIVPAWKPSARSSSSRAFAQGGPRKPLAASSTARVAAPSSLMSMRRARPHGNVRCPAVLTCLPPNADSMRSVLLATGTQAWGGGAHTHHGLADAHAPMGRDVCRQGQRRLSRGTGFGTASHHHLFEALRLSTRDGTGPSGRSLWRCDRRRSTAAGRHLFRDAMERISALGAPHIQRVLAHAPTASVTRRNSGEVVELFEGGWLELGEDVSRVRVIVARHAAPAPREAHSGRQACRGVGL